VIVVHRQHKLDKKAVVLPQNFTKESFLRIGSIRREPVSRRCMPRMWTAPCIRWSAPRRFPLKR
jgi:hypothetical protein